MSKESTAPKMTEEQKTLFNALTTLQQEISLNSLSGMNDIDSYKNSSGKAEKENTMRATVSEILANPNVELFLDAMKESAVSDAIMSRTRMLELQTQIADIGNKELSLMSLGALNEFKGALDVKLKAMNQIADLVGYKAAKKTELTGADGEQLAIKSEVSAPEIASALVGLMDKL